MEIIYSFLFKNQAGRGTDSVFEERITQEEKQFLPGGSELEPAEIKRSPEFREKRYVTRR